MRHTKIVCTIGPSSSSVEMLDRLVAAGMDVARLNFSHGTHAEHAEVIRRIRGAEARFGRPIAILQDLQGPKIRLGTFGPAGGERVDLEPGNGSHWWPGPRRERRSACRWPRRKASRSSSPATPS